MTASLEIRPAGDRIDAPGFYEMAAADYHADPCPEPSLSASLALLLLHRSPRHAWWRHPRLNPQYEADTSKRLDFGSTVHSLLLEAGRDLVVIDAGSYRGKDAKAERDGAHADGRIPVLVADYEKAKDMAKTARAIIERDVGAILNPESHAETVLAWREGPVWCRAMLDLCAPDLTCILDYKTTGLSARPVDAERTLYNLGYHFKAAFYERGLDILDPVRRGRRRFLFLFQETEPPYEGALLEPDEGGMTIARKQITAAIELWQRCIEAGQWPGYPSGVHRAAIPGWAEQAWLNREMTDPDLTGALAPGGDRLMSDEPEREWKGWTP